MILINGEGGWALREKVSMTVGFRQEVCMLSSRKSMT